MNLRNKIILAGAGAVILAIAGAVGTVYHLARGNRVNELRKLMSSQLQQAEHVRDYVDSFHNDKSIEMSRLLEVTKGQSNGRPMKEVYAQTPMYRTIPVVAGWDAAKEAAKNTGFEFLVPARPGTTPRNPKNGNGEAFKGAFDAFAQGQTEYFTEDAANGRLILARPARLLASCLLCHGDPAKSLTHDGLDPLGLPMEGAKEGDVKGAFIMIAPITNDAVVQATMWRIGLVGIGILALVMVGFHFFNRSMIIRPLGVMIDNLKAGSTQTDAASSQVSSASQSLAQGATEQAAALEETASALEEMSSMTKRNAETAQQAATLSSEAKKAADQGNHTMTKMGEAINEIQKSAQETAKIIKVIDEIAFQTNLLALNAAVEAARAGEAGKGFAVVAEEVRNLALRSAEAARNTASMIDESVTSAKKGVSISTEVAKMLEEITGVAQKVNALVGEIAAASQEQAQGIEQVNVAVAEMDKVTQTNAASAEQTAAAAKELSTQAEEMNQMIRDLFCLVGNIDAQPKLATPEHANKETPAPRHFADSAPRMAVVHPPQWRPEQQPGKIDI